MPWSAASTTSAPLSLSLRPANARPDLLVHAVSSHASPPASPSPRSRKTSSSSSSRPGFCSRSTEVRPARQPSSRTNADARYLAVIWGGLTMSGAAATKVEHRASASFSHSFTPASLTHPLSHAVYAIKFFQGMAESSTFIGAVSPARAAASSTCRPGRALTRSLLARSTTSWAPGTSRPSSANVPPSLRARHRSPRCFPARCKVSSLDLVEARPIS